MGRVRGGRQGKEGNILGGAGGVEGGELERGTGVGCGMAGGRGPASRSHDARAVKV